MIPSLLLAFALAQTQPADPSAGLRELLAQARSLRGFPGAVARVSRRGETLALAAVGVRVAGRDEPVEPADRFHLGSVTKPLTATLLATLVEEGRLRWDSTLEEMFPGRPIHRALRAVTLVQLLTHRAGLPGFRGQDEIEQAPRLYGEPMSRRAQFAGWLLARKPEREPGTFWYSNADFAVAAAAAELATGKPYEMLMRERVFAPLGMASAGFGWPAALHAHEPWGHRMEHGKPRPHDPHDAYGLDAVLAPGADAHMNVADLGRFLDDQARGLLGERALLATSTYRLMHAQGIGWMVGAAGASSEHVGGAETFYAVAMVGHDDGLALALLVNDGDGAAAVAAARAAWNLFRENAAAR